MLRSARNYAPEKQLESFRARVKTNVKRGSEEIARSEQFARVFADSGVYEQLLESLKEGVVIVNKRLKIQYTNSRFSHLARVHRPALTGIQLGALLRVSGGLDLPVLVRRALKRASSHEGEIIYGNGRRLRIQFSICAFRMRNHVLFGITVTDLSLRHQYEHDLRRQGEELRAKNAALQKANEDLSSFTFIASHHLQEPLRKIQTFVNLIAGTQPLFSAKTDDYFKRITTAANRMQALLSDLLIFCSTRNGDYEFVETDLHALLRECIQTCSRGADHKITTEVRGHLPVLKVIPFQIKLLFQQLLNNSVKFCPVDKVLHLKVRCRIEKGRTEVGLHVSEKYYRISFSDNGIGFDEKYNDRIFEIFQKLHRNEEYDGTGMGLALCRRVAENHRGIIRASAKQGCGARFDVYLPEKCCLPA